MYLSISKTQGTEKDSQGQTEISHLLEDHTPIFSQQPEPGQAKARSLNLVLRSARDPASHLSLSLPPPGWALAGNR